MQSDSTTEATICACGCGQPLNPTKFQLSKRQAESRRFIRGHHIATPRVPLATRFWQRVNKTDGCWLWIGLIGTRGYGKIGAGGVRGPTLLAHRVSWELHFGPIPDGMFVCHHCDNPACVRPDHLFLGKPRDNTADMFAKGRANPPRGEACPWSRLTAQQVGEIRGRRGESPKKLATEYGVSVGAITGIFRGVNWQVTT